MTMFDGKMSEIVLMLLIARSLSAGV